MNILNLFAGMECGKLAVEKLGVNFNIYYSSEIDESAIATTKDNFQDITFLGDIENWEEWDIDWGNIDLVMGGSPCQGFSRIGKSLNFNDPRSALFFVFVDIINHAKNANPEIKFMLENVQMKQEWIDVISDKLGVPPVMIDASYFTAHSRPRLFWCNWKVNQPDWQEKRLSDVLGFDAVGCSRRARYINGKSGKTFQKLEVRKDNLANCMTTVSKNSKLLVNGDERNLTVDEGCVLQGVPSGYFRNTKKTRALKMLGNGWNVDVIVYILSQMR